MKKFILSLIFSAVILNSGSFIISKAYAQPEPTAEARVAFFYDSLQPYGNWIFHDKYGWCWYPNNIEINWRPYTNGYWVYTDRGWSWVSNYSWGWACFHYGRWFFDDTYGWLWYPDTVWAPSWCVWRTGEDWVGWAPLPPEAIWQANAGLVFSEFDSERYIPEYWYCFVRRRDFLDRDIRRRMAMVGQNATIIRHTLVDVTNIRIRDKHIINELPVQKELEKDIGHPIKSLRIVDADSAGKSGVSGNENRVFRPRSMKPVRTERVVPKVAPVVSPRQEMKIPAELQQRHQSEAQGLQKLQENRKRQLEEQHANEIKSPPVGYNQEQIKARHQAESDMQQRQMTREKNLLQNWHQQENKTNPPAGRAVQQHFNISAPQAQEKQEKGQEERQGEEGRRK